MNEDKSLPTPQAEPPLSPEGTVAAQTRPGTGALSPYLQDRHVLVLGLGASGLAMARWCARVGARVTVADTREAPPQADALRAAVPAARLLHGALDATLLDGQNYTLIARSPGLPPADWQGLADAAAAAGIPFLGELDLFTQALREIDGYAPKLLGVTGTNGKTTVTALTGLLLERAGVKVAVAGNIAPAMLERLADGLDAGALPDVWVLELSSFQLHGVRDFEPLVGTVLNLSEDHLDWHGDMAAYGADKARIFGASGLMLLNRQDPRVMALQPQPVVQREGNRTRTLAAREHVSFGTDVPTRPGDWGLETVNGMTWLVRAQALDETRKPKRGRRVAGPPQGAAAPSGGSEPCAAGSVGAYDDEPEVYLQRLMPAEALRIRGRHNAANALAALALATAAGAPLGPMLHGLREYRGEPHRVAPVAVVGEVEYFDDSKGTNVGATLAAIDGLGAERRLVLILGGDGKGQDFSPLAPAVARHVRAVVLIGRDAPAIRDALLVSGVPLHDAATLQDAVRQCAALARSGDAVLLSPACASLDMFRNYGHRAEVFVAAVRELALAAGGDME